MLNEVGAIERHLEEEPQRRDGGIDLGCARPARRQMQAIAPYVLRLGRGRRAFKERGEVLDPLHIVMLGLCCELADRHVFDHAPTQRADGLLGHGDAPVLSEVVQTPHLKTGRTHPLPYELRSRPSRSTLPRERFSPLARGGSYPPPAGTAADWGTC